MNKPLKVFFAHTQNMGVVYYRFHLYAKHMTDLGAEVAMSRYSSYDDEVIQWQFDVKNPLVVKQLEMLFSTADITVMGGLRNPMAVALVQAARELFKKPVYMEIDDYVFNLPGYNCACNTYKPDNVLEWTLRKQMEVSDGVIVSTPALKELYSPINKNIFVVPNGVEVDHWTKLHRFKKEKDTIRIGFSGSPNHTGDIRLVKNVLNKVLEKYDNVELYFMGCVPDFFSYTKNVICDDIWTPVEDFPHRLAEANFDIAIAPLKDNLFNRGKSNLRYLEASMLKLPVVASPSADYSRTIKHGENGFLCNTDEEWFDTLCKLIESKELRDTIGQNGYDFVAKNYDIRNISKDYIDILNDCVKQGLRG